MLALYWLVQGYGYEITSTDAWAAHDGARTAAENGRGRPEMRERIKKLVSNRTSVDAKVIAESR